MNAKVSAKINAKVNSKVSAKVNLKVKSIPDLSYETEVGYPILRVAGADEVGRGCVAGPVVAAALILPPLIDRIAHPWLNEINDSKLLSPASRERLSPLIQSWALSFAIGTATVEEIDQINILNASFLAMERALKSLNPLPQRILVDGKFLPKKPLCAPATAVIKGDQKCLSIAAASIIAKVWRDQHMTELDLQYPGYGFAQHKGYPTLIHTRALKLKGATRVHRRSFKTVFAVL